MKLFNAFVKKKSHTPHQPLPSQLKAAETKKTLTESHLETIRQLHDMSKTKPLNEEQKKQWQDIVNLAVQTLQKNQSSLPTMVKVYNLAQQIIKISNTPITEHLLPKAIDIHSSPTLKERNSEEVRETIKNFYGAKECKIETIKAGNSEQSKIPYRGGKSDPYQSDSMKITMTWDKSPETAAKAHHFEREFDAYLDNSSNNFEMMESKDKITKSYQIFGDNAMKFLSGILQSLEKRLTSMKEEVNQEHPKGP